MTDTKTYDDVLAGARPNRRTVLICLRGDLTAQFEELERQLQDAEQADPPSTSMEAVPAALELAQQIEDLREQMQAATYTFVLQALPEPKYRALKGQHPPRQDDDGEVLAADRWIDANMQSFTEPLFRACLVDPALDDTGWAKTNEALSSNQYDELMFAAIMVNKGGVNVPFSQAASRRLQSSDPS